MSIRSVIAGIALMFLSTSAYAEVFQAKFEGIMYYSNRSNREVFMGTSTDTGLYKPATNEVGWDGSVNTNWDHMNEVKKGFAKTNWAATYISTSSFSVVGDKTAFYIPGCAIKSNLSGSSVISTVVSATYSGGITTVVTADATLNNTITDAEFSLVGPSNYYNPKQVSRVTSAFNKTNDTALANIPGLTANVIAGKTYKFKAILFCSGDPTGNSKYAMSGSATATVIVYGISFDGFLSQAGAVVQALNTATVLSGQGLEIIRIDGLLTVNATGTLTVQFAENVASGTSSVLIGSVFEVEMIP